jgi:hypothetical protein
VYSQLSNQDRSDFPTLMREAGERMARLSTANLDGQTEEQLAREWGDLQRAQARLKSRLLQAGLINENIDYDNELLVVDDDAAMTLEKQKLEVGNQIHLLRTPPHPCASLRILRITSLPFAYTPSPNQTTTL